MNLFQDIRHGQQRLTTSLVLIFRKNQFVLFLIVILIFSGCWEKNYDYTYAVYIENATNDTLFVKCGVETVDISVYPYRAFEILPNDTLSYGENRFGTFSINEGTAPVPFFFENFDSNKLDTVQVYRNDSLKVEWTYPARSAPVEEHDFFNYNSWGTPVIDNTRAILFTIHESDLK